MTWLEILALNAFMGVVIYWLLQRKFYELEKRILDYEVEIFRQFAKKTEASQILNDLIQKAISKSEDNAKENHP